MKTIHSGSIKYILVGALIAGFCSTIKANDSIPTATAQLPHSYLTSSKSNTTTTNNSPLFNHFRTPEKWEKLTASFSVQSDMLFSRANDDTQNTWRANNYVVGTIRNNYLEFGVRFEDLLSPLPGRNAIEAGRGIPFIYASGKYGNVAQVTVGDFYDRFGSGIIFRSYEDRALGIDNAVRGAHLMLRPLEGLTFKALWGQQRYTFDRTFKLFNKQRGYVSGADLELSISEWASAMQQNNIALTFGGSVVNKQESDEDVFVIRDGKNYRLNLPQNVPAYGGRMNFAAGGFTVNGEYAYKPNDPTADNFYVYRPGSVAMLSLSYTQKGLSALLQAKRSENFNYISKRSLLGMHLHLNHMPPFSAQHTYALAALYPYATQNVGEWAFQGEFRYMIPRHSALGGKYGTNIRVNFSHIRGLKKDYLPEVDPSKPSSFYGTDGFKTSFFGMGDLYFSDIDLEISKKVTPKYSFTFTYLHQIYNQQVVEGHVENALQQTPHIWSNIFIYDGSYKFSREYTLRTELQFLATKHAEGNWIYGLAELSVSPNWMFTVSDQYNMGVTKQHYYMASITYTKAAHRFMLSLGRTRAGMNCSGGVCRWMPQTKGIYLSYNGNF